MTERRTTLLVLCPYPLGLAAGQRLKFEQYYADWRKAGFDVTVLPFADEALYSIMFTPGNTLGKIRGALKGYNRRWRDLIRVSSFDLVYVHQWVTPLGPPLFEWAVRKCARRLVYDLEDNVLAGQKDAGPSANPLARFLKGTKKAPYLVRVADHVVTSSPALAAQCATLNYRGAATYISSSIDTDHFVPVNRYEGTEGLTIGWTGTHSTRPMLDLLRPVFRRLAERIPFKLRVIGNFEYQLSGIDLEVLRWSPEEEVAQLQGIDVGVYPLPLDQEEWVSGKSGLKAIQYMAFGLPVVASNVGNTPCVVRDGKTGLLVRSDDDWVEALERLARNPALRRQLGEQGRKVAVERYSVKATAEKYRSVQADALKVKT